MATVFMLIGIILVSVILVVIPILLRMDIEQERDESTLVFLTFFVSFELLGLIVLLSVLIL